MQTRLWDTMGIPAKSDRHGAFSKLSLMPHQLLHPRKNTQLYSSAVSNSIHSFTQQTCNESRQEGHGCIQLNRGGEDTFDCLVSWSLPPGSDYQVLMLGSDYAEEAVLSNEGRGHPLSHSPGS